MQWRRAILALVVAGLFYYGWSRLPHRDLPGGSQASEPLLRSQLGQTFAVGIPGPALDSRTQELLRDIKPGGVVLYRRNFTSAGQLRKLIADLQELARQTTGRPFLIMIDEEPGGATRLGLFRNVFAFGDPDWEQIERDIAAMQRLGINVELAPVADFPFREDSFIRRRVPARSTVAALSRFNRQFILLLNKHGISATLKHFPGMGVFSTDPHQDLPGGRMGAKTLEASLEVFRDGIAAGAGMVMTGHGMYSDIDPSGPATLSPEIVGGLLQQKLGFEGLVLTDDLSEMPFITGSGLPLEEATARALKAGHTMVLFSHQLSRTESILDQVCARAEKDQDLQATVKRNYRKIVAFKDARVLTITPAQLPASALINANLRQKILDVQHGSLQPAKQNLDMAPAGPGR